MGNVRDSNDWFSICWSARTTTGEREMEIMNEFRERVKGKWKVKSRERERGRESGGKRERKRDKKREREVKRERDIQRGVREREK